LQLLKGYFSGDVFELQTVGDRLLVRGNNGVSMASGLNWYLKHYLNCQISYHSSQLNIPAILPEIAEKVRIVSPHIFRSENSLLQLS
jgi:alpha-N-acetylglucosaminidase